METKNLPVLLDIALTLKTIIISYKKHIHNFSIDLPVEQLGLLFLANFKDDLIQQDMADFMKRDKSAILRQIDIMEEKGLVQRVADPQDRRKNILTITDKGKKLARVAFEMEKELFKDMQKGISNSDMETFNRVLLQLKNNAEKK